MVTVTHLSIILVFVSLSSQLSQAHSSLFQACVVFSLSPLYRFISPSVHRSHLRVIDLTLTNLIDLTLTDLTHCRYDLNKKTTPWQSSETSWRSLDGMISLARDPKMTLWRSSQGHDVWVLMGIDLWVLIGLMVVGILMGGLNILIGGF